MGDIILLIITIIWGLFAYFLCMLNDRSVVKNENNHNSNDK